MKRRGGEDEFEKKAGRKPLGRGRELLEVEEGGEPLGEPEPDAELELFEAAAAPATLCAIFPYNSPRYCSAFSGFNQNGLDSKKVSNVFLLLDVVEFGVPVGLGGRLKGLARRWDVREGKDES